MYVQSTKVFNKICKTLWICDIRLFSPVSSKPQLLQGVYAMGFNRPSKIQETALPMMLAEPWVTISVYAKLI